MIRTENRFGLFARVVLTLALTLGQVVWAQSPAPQTPVKQDITIVIQQQQVRFAATQIVEQLHLQVTDQAGEVVFDSGASGVQEVFWPLQYANGAPLKSGLYAYTLTIKEAGANEARVRRGHFIVDRAQDRDGTDKLWVTSPNTSGVGTELTVARDEYATVAGTTTSSERLVGQRAENSGRGNSERGVEAGTKDQTLAAKTNTVAAAYGTTGYIAKFTSASDLGNSVLAELNGNIGIGMTPRHRLSIGSGPIWTANGWGGAIELENANAIGWKANAAGQRFGIGHTNTGTYFFRTTSDPGTTGSAANYDLMISDTGNVGIGTIAPYYKFDVAGNLRSVRDDSNDIVVQTTAGTNAWARMSMITPGQHWAWGTSQNYNGNQLYLYDATFNQVRMMVQPNAGEVSFPSPSSNHIVVRTSGGTNAWAQLRMATTNQTWAMGTSQNYNGDQFYLFDATRNQARLMIQPDGGDITLPLGNVGIGTTNPQAKLHVEGTTMTSVLQITGGADFAENFDVNVAPSNAAEALKVEAGMVVSIDPASPGKLVLSTQAYDRRVAGIISGAGGVKPGMMMSQAGTLAHGQHPVALTGRVYCWVDASQGAVEPGDLLTTSATLGHAMKVSDPAKAQGAIIGKAMTGLKEGKGLVLVLVTLQ
jgi:hypothetical protein